MTITVTLSDQEMQLARLALGVAKHIAEIEKAQADITGRYMTGEVIGKYEDLEKKLYAATLAEIRKVKGAKA